MGNLPHSNRTQSACSCLAESKFQRSAELISTFAASVARLCVPRVVRLDLFFFLLFPTPICVQSIEKV